MLQMTKFAEIGQLKSELQSIQWKSVLWTENSAWITEQTNTILKPIKTFYWIFTRFEFDFFFA